MEIDEFREKMQELSEMAEAQEKQIRADQVRARFPDLEEEQQTLIFRYLKTKGIAVSDEGGKEWIAESDGEQKQEEAEPGAPTGSNAKQQNPERRENLRTENPCLTEKDRAWLTHYKEELFENSSAAALFAGDGREDPRLRRYLPIAADLAAEAYRDGMNLADLVQEANLALLTILAGDSAEMEDAELLRRLRLGVREAANEQDEQNFGDETLVAKVRNLEAVMKDLTEEGGEPKFTVEELAILLDMDIEEMKDIIRLTGEGD